MGMESLLSSPTAIRTVARALGLTAARLDIHPDTNALILSVAQGGHVHHIDVPIGQTFTADQICEILAGPSPAGEIPPDPAAPASVTAAPAGVSPP